MSGTFDDPVHDKGFTKRAEDISITGCDDVPEAALWNPGLTTVAVPKHELGRLASLALIERLNDPERARVRDKVGAELIIRGSTAPVPVRDE